MHDTLPPRTPALRLARVLLRCGIAAGPLYLALGIAQALFREGYDPRKHALSLLANGEFGSVQVANFLASGALVIAGAIGCRFALRGHPGSTWGPTLLSLYGIGLVGAGLFPADPVDGFPPGSTAPERMSADGLLHFVSGGLGFYALIAACFVFARRFSRLGRRALARFSLATGIGFFAAFAAVGSGSTAPAVLIAFTAAVAWIWVWHTLALFETLRRTRSAPADVP